MPLDDTWIARVADLTCQARAQLHGARNWDPPGVAAQIRRVAHLAMPEVVTACMRAAADRTINTPAPISDLTSSAWRERFAEPVTTRPRLCPHHGTQYRGQICPSCRADEIAIKD